MRNMSKEDYLNFLDTSTNKELLSSLELNHSPVEKNYTININRNNGSINISSLQSSKELINAFKKADRIFLKLSKKKRNN